MSVTTFPVYETALQKRLDDVIKRAFSHVWSRKLGRPPFGPAVSAANIWWTNNGSIPSPVAAYRAVSTPGSVWGVGPASLAESYINLANPGTYTLTLGVAPTWAGATGWTFNGIDQYLNTNIVPSSTYTIIGRVDSSTTNSIYLFGIVSLFGVRKNSSGVPQYWSGTSVQIGDVFTGGTIGVANINAIRDGAIVYSLLSGIISTAYSILIGCGNSAGTPALFMVGTQQALWIANYDASAYAPTLHTILGQL